MNATARAAMPRVTSSARAASTSADASVSSLFSVWRPPLNAAPRGGLTSRARISSRGGTEAASGSASDRSCARALGVWGATRIEDSGGTTLGNSASDSLRASSSSSSTGAPSSLRGSSSLSSGPAMNVVTSAMITSIANSASEITPFSSARLSTISSVRPRVFISTPTTAAGFHAKPVARAAISGADRTCRRSPPAAARGSSARAPAGRAGRCSCAGRCRRRTAAAGA